MAVSTACVSILLNMLALQRVIMTAPSTPTGKCSAEIEHEACCMYAKKPVVYRWDCIGYVSWMLGQNMTLDVVDSCSPTHASIACETFTRRYPTASIHAEIRGFHQKPCNNFPIHTSMWCNRSKWSSKENMSAKMICSKSVNCQSYDPNLTSSCFQKECTTSWQVAAVQGAGTRCVHLTVPPVGK